MLVYSWALQGFPGQREAASFQYASGSYDISFLHFTTPEGAAGFLRTGTLFPSTRETMSMASPGPAPLGFFGRGAIDRDPQDPIAMSKWVSEQCNHGKAGWSLAVTGQLQGRHVKFQRGDTAAEQRLLYRNICVRSGSTDGRWVFRSDAAVPSFVHIVADQEDDSWGSWSASVALGHQSAPAISMSVST